MFVEGRVLIQTDPVRLGWVVHTQIDLLLNGTPFQGKCKKKEAMLLDFQNKECSPNSFMSLFYMYF